MQSQQTRCCPIACTVAVSLLGYSLIFITRSHCICNHAYLTGLELTQVWRPLRGPVDDSPLGMIDAASVAKEDLLPYAIHFPGRTGYNYAVSYNPEHRQVSPCMELQPPGQLYANWFFRVRIFEIVNHAAEKCCRCCETHTILLQQ